MMDETDDSAILRRFVLEVVVDVLLVQGERRTDEATVATAGEVMAV
jgi:hypothetical protein